MAAQTMWRASGTSPLLLIAAGSVLLGLPLFHHAFPLGDDSPWHLVYQEHFGEQFWKGELYPRWLAGANAGLGSPIFFVYGPLPYWLGSLLRPLGERLPWTDRESFALGLSAFAALLGSGLAAYAWLREAHEKGVAAAGAVLYMAMPYHYLTDLLVRSALAEYWSFVWLPLVLYFSQRLAKGKPLALPGLAASTALLVMTHLFSMLIFMGFAILYGGLFLPERAKWRGVVRLACALALGTGLAAVYLGPALAHGRHLAIGRLNSIPHLHYANNFLPASLTGGDGITPVTLITLAVAGWSFFRTRSEAAKTFVRERRFWLATGLFSVAMMLPLAKPLWGKLPILHVVQFPWRFNLALAVAATALLTMALGGWQARAASGWRAGWMVLPWVLILGVIGTVKAAELRNRNQAAVRSLVAAGSEGQQIVLWARGTLWDASRRVDTRQLSGGSEPVRAEDTGHAEVLKWAPRDIRIRVTSEREGPMVVRQLYYPGWEARDAASRAALKIEPTRREGLIRVWVPAGEHQVVLRLHGGVMEGLGAAISGVCLLVLAGGVVVRRLRLSA